MLIQVDFDKIQTELVTASAGYCVTGVIFGGDLNPKYSKLPTDKFRCTFLQITGV
jgi:hypothetical protein